MTLATNIANAFTRVATEFKAIRTLIGGSGTAGISALTTTDKSSLVAAINEIKASNAGSPPDATTTTKGIIEIATLAEVTTGTDTARAVTPQGVKQAFDAALAAVVGGAPGVLDTLDELAAALGDDPNFAATMASDLAGKAPLASPALTGTPTAPTADPGTNTTQVATTAFVMANAPSSSSGFSTTFMLMGA